MPIKKRDGSTYKLVGPNPMMLAQEVWDDESILRFHNLDNLSPPLITHEITQLEELDEPPTDVVTMEPSLAYIAPAPVVVATPPPVEKVEKKGSRYRELGLLHFYCLSGRVEEKVDSLYGDKVTRVVYGDSFKFQGTVAQSGDLQCIIWTTVKQVALHSIIYNPAAYRWWKVEKITPEPSGDGLMLSCVISDLQPDFSSLEKAQSLT